VSVPFERFPPLKDMIEQRRRWRRLDDDVSYFETSWKPKSWDQRHRFLFIRKRVHRQNKAPLQLDLFVPHEEGYDFKVIVTNKRAGARHVVAFHEGRGAQEGIFAELKSHCHRGGPQGLDSLAADVRWSPLCIGILPDTMFTVLR